eukprot:15166212-Ditylum_brightwellii.AAC.1
MLDEEDKDGADIQHPENKSTANNTQANKHQTNEKREADSSKSNTAKKANIGTAIDINMEEQGKEQEGLATQEERATPNKHHGSVNVQKEDDDWADAIKAAAVQRAKEQAAIK